MNERDSGALQAYSLKLTFSNGRRITIPQKLLTRAQAESIADKLYILARESGLEITECELCPVSRDEQDQVLQLASCIFKEEERRTALPKIQTAVKCGLCQGAIPLDEALATSPQAHVLLNGDSIIGDSRCETCSRHSVENCYECRAELFLTTGQSQFICSACRQRYGNDVV